ncbi:FtsK/SpoIIIE family protein [Actinocorallia herbida]|uniref:FtsK/SpoIIIE family protein n=1 Tax=Actinocorallia herbida TaxID=58109 RepID=A0A3N1D5J1_9ACTN|nr:FtsK/SpoIIIE domain-containing protein [Actinocorallia herbida]ROO88739.1 FtsK/SpoIIIE family protein [Actinocorallia herbida]
MGVGLPPVRELPDIPVRAPRTAGAWLAILVIRPAWLWRREYLLGLVLVGAGAAGWWRLGLVGLGLPLVLLSSLAVPGTRALLGGWLAGGRLKRRWDRGCRFAGLTTSNDRIPRVLKIQRVPVGERLRVRMPRGSTVSELEAATEQLAADLRIRGVEVRREPSRADLASVLLRRRDPWESAGPVPWPWLERPQSRLWEPVPVGLDEVGDLVTLTLPGRNLLLGGEPEAGKSAAMTQLIAAAALDPWVTLVGLDAKRLELSLWQPCFDQVAFAKMDDAIALLESVISDMDSVYERMAAERLRKVPSYARLTVVVVDELRFYTAHPDRVAREHFNGLLIDLVARGRAAGFPVVAATQKPSADVVPTSLRDLFGYRWALRSNTRDASDTILGAGWASLGHSAATVPVGTRGVGLLLGEGQAEPVRCRSFYLSDGEVEGVAARGAELRRGVRRG